jgi:hypothetical protein
VSNWKLGAALRVQTLARAGGIEVAALRTSDLASESRAVVVVNIVSRGPNDISVDGLLVLLVVVVEGLPRHRHWLHHVHLVFLRAFIVHLEFRRAVIEPLLHPALLSRLRCCIDSLLLELFLNLQKQNYTRIKNEGKRESSSQV